jgi:hypothetical protein
VFRVYSAVTAIATGVPIPVATHCYNNRNNNTNNNRNKNRNKIKTGIRHQQVKETGYEE